MSALSLRVQALEAQNARLLDLAERQAAEQQRLCACLERLTATLERMAGIEAPEPPEEPALPRPSCRAVPPPRRCRPGGRRLW